MYLFSFSFSLLQQEDHVMILRYLLARYLFYTDSFLELFIIDKMLIVLSKTDNLKWVFFCSQLVCCG